MVLGLLWSSSWLAGCGKDAKSSPTNDDDAGTQSGGDGDTTQDGGGPGDSDAGSNGPAPPSDVRPVSGTRLKQAWLHSGDTRAPADTILDSQYDVPCYFQLTEDGVERCVPQGESVYFADEDCTEAVVPDFPGVECAGPTPEFGRQRIIGDEACEPWRLRVFAVGEEEVAVTAIYELDGDGNLNKPHFEVHIPVAVERLRAVCAAHPMLEAVPALLGD
jgi:hypothetical protein